MASGLRFSVSRLLASALYTPFRDSMLSWYNSSMSIAPFLDRIFDPLQHVLNVDAARQIVDWRADAETQTRLEQLAEKSTEGSLTDAEREEYDAYIHAIDFIGILQAKARAVLKRNSA